MAPAPLLKTADVASLMNVSRSTVARWVALGHLEAVRTPGGSLRFRPEDVDALTDAPPDEAAS